MDGIDNRGEIVVIRATNRLDSTDPALWRPGRFDRERLFNLPNKEKLFHTVIELTEGFDIFHLEKVYGVINQCIYKHRED